MAQDDSGDNEKRGLLADLSAAQVIAGALASVTSMLLTEQVGIAGGIIGVIVSSVAYTVTSKVYGNALKGSGERLQARLGQDLTLTELRHATSARPANGAGQTERMPRPAPRPSETTAGTAPRAATPCEPAPYSASTHTPEQEAVEASDPAERFAGERMAPAKLRAEAQARRQAELRRKVMLVSVVVALVAVAATALVVSALTAGNGLGTKPSQIVSDAATSTAQTTSATTTAATTKAATTQAATSAATSAATTEGATAQSQPAAQTAQASTQQTTSEAAKTSTSAEQAPTTSKASASAASSPAAQGKVTAQGEATAQGSATAQGEATAMAEAEN